MRAVWFAAVAAAALAACGETLDDEASDVVTLDAAADEGVADAEALDEATVDGMADAMDEAPDAVAPESGVEPPDAQLDPPDARPTPPDLGPDAAPPCLEPLQATVDGDVIEALRFPPTAAQGPAARVELMLTNPCARRLRFLGHPDAWIEGEGFALEQLPPILLEAGAATALVVRFDPREAGEVRGAIALPYDGPGAPLRIALHADVEGPRRIVFAGDGRHVVTTADYGDTVAFDGFESLVAHGDALQRGVCWGAGRFVAVGGNDDQRWWTSADGVEWVAHRADGGVLAGCAYGDGRFVATDGGPMWSLDGEAWTDGDFAGFDPNHLRAIGFGGGVFVAVGDNGRVATTTDGTAWVTDRVLDVGSLTAVAWGAGRHVAVGEDGAVATSDDGGATWRTSSAPDAGRLGGIVFVDGRFVTGDGVRTFDSVDGIEWSPVNASVYVPRVAWGRIIFGSTGLTLARSDDGGYTWRPWHTSEAGLGTNRAAVEGL